MKLSFKLKWSRKKKSNKKRRNKSSKKKWDCVTKEKECWKTKWKRKNANSKRPMSNILRKSNRSKKSCKILSKANGDNFNNVTIRRKELSKICWLLWNSKKKSASKRRKWSEGKRQNISCTWRSSTPEKRPSKWRSKKSKWQKTKSSKNLEYKRKGEESKLKKWKTWESNFTKKSFKLKLVEKNNKKLKSVKISVYKCKPLNVRPDKEKFVNVRKSKEWSSNLEPRCWRSLPVKISSNKWLSKREEWKKLNTKDK